MIAWEAGKRLLEPPDVEGALVLVVGIAGAGANVACAAALSRAERKSLNVAGAMAHVLTDLYASIAAALSGALILLTGVGEFDGIAALVVAALMVASGWRLLRDASAVLLEGAPAGVDPDRVGRTLAAQPGIVEVHDLHVWEVTSGFHAVAAHVIVAAGEDCHQRRRDLQRVLAEEFGVEHTTLQVDHAAEPGQLLTIEPAALVAARGRSRPPRRRRLRVLAHHGVALVALDHVLDVRELVPGPNGEVAASSARTASYSAGGERGRCSEQSRRPHSQTNGDGFSPPGSPRRSSRSRSLISRKLASLLAIRGARASISRRTLCRDRARDEHGDVVARLAALAARRRAPRSPRRSPPGRARRTRRAARRAAARPRPGRGRAAR